MLSRVLGWGADDPQDAVVASQYKKDRKAWEAQAKQWTEAYATNNTELKVKKVRFRAPPV